MSATRKFCLHCGYMEIFCQCHARRIAQIEEAESLRQDRVAQLAENQREASGQRMRNVRPNNVGQP